MMDGIAKLMGCCRNDYNYTLDIIFQSFDIGE